MRIDGIGLIAAPPHILDPLRRMLEKMLLDARELSRILPGRTDPIGTADLLYTARTPDPGLVAARTAGPDDLSTVRDDVSSSEWEESGIAGMDRTWVVSASPTRPAAIAGYEVWQPTLAQLGIIATPQHRGTGAAYAAAATATEDALNHGLIAQWRSRLGNNASKRLAQRLGYAQLGVQSSVALSA